MADGVAFPEVLAPFFVVFLRTTVAVLTMLPMMRSFVVTSLGSEELQAISPPGASVSFGHSMSPARLASMTERFLKVVVPRLVTYGRQCHERGGGGMNAPEGRGGAGSGTYLLLTLF